MLTAAQDLEIASALRRMADSVQAPLDLTSSVEQLAASRVSRRRAAAIAAVSAVACGTAIVGSTSYGIPGGRATPAVSQPATPDAGVSDQEWALGAVSYEHKLVDEAQVYASFVGARLDTSAREVVLYGSAEAAPASVAALINAAPAGIGARFVSVPYTARQLDEAGGAIGASLPDVAYTTVADDFQSIIVGVYHLPPGGMPLHRLRSKVAAVTDVPVIFRLSQGFAAL